MNVFTISYAEDHISKRPRGRLSRFDPHSFDTPPLILMKHAIYNCRPDSIYLAHKIAGGGATSA